MRTRLLWIVLVFGVVTGVAADDTIEDLTVFADAFEDFSDEFARSLPTNAQIGLTWSDAYIGQLLAVPPNFGVGVTGGVTTVPSSVFDDLIDDLGVTSSKGVGDLAAIGLVLPGYAFDARIGGIGIPFDAGIKFGVMPALSLGDVEAEYTNVGFDVRYAVLEGGLLPKLSVGVGYTYLSGSISAPLGPSETTVVSVDDATTPAVESYALVLSDPEVASEWSSNVFDFAVQMSKSFLVLEPHIGLGASYGISSVESGIDADLEVQDGSGNPVAGVDPSDISGAGADVSSDGLSVSSDVDALTFRVFGGASINVVILRFDLGLTYTLNSGAFGATFGTRVQL